ncbi:MAG: hypothetical protein GY821_17685 [Gammaproteobacteria bacterium]|nr:hypothetical protein [Gammaproteobacteria bacterium]
MLEYANKFLFTNDMRITLYHHSDDDVADKISNLFCSLSFYKELPNNVWVRFFKIAETSINKDSEIGWRQGQKYKKGSINKDKIISNDNRENKNHNNGKTLNINTFKQNDFCIKSIIKLNNIQECLPSNFKLEIPNANLNICEKIIAIVKQKERLEIFKNENKENIDKKKLNLLNLHLTDLENFGKNIDLDLRKNPYRDVNNINTQRSMNKLKKLEKKILQKNKLDEWKKKWSNFLGCFWTNEEFKKITPHQLAEKATPTLIATTASNVIAQETCSTTTKIINAAIRNETHHSLEPAIHHPIQPSIIAHTDNALLGDVTSIHIDGLAIHLSKAQFLQFSLAGLFLICARRSKSKAMRRLYYGLAILMIGMNLALMLCNPYGLVLTATILGIVSASLQVIYHTLCIMSVYGAVKQGKISKKKAVGLILYHLILIALNCFTLGMAGLVLKHLPLIMKIVSTHASTISQKMALLKQASELSGEQMPVWAQIVSFSILVSNVCILALLAVFNAGKWIVNKARGKSDMENETTVEKNLCVDDEINASKMDEEVKDSSDEPIRLMCS